MRGSILTPRVTKKGNIRPRTLEFDNLGWNPDGLQHMRRWPVLQIFVTGKLTTFDNELTIPKPSHFS